MVKTIRNLRIENVLNEEFLSNEDARFAWENYFLPQTRKVYDLSSIRSYPALQRLYLQNLGDARYTWGAYTNARVCVPTPLPANLHGVSNSYSDTTTSTSEVRVLNLAYSIQPDFLKKIRIKGRPVFNGLFGVVSSAAAGTAGSFAPFPRRCSRPQRPCRHPGVLRRFSSGVAGLRKSARTTAAATP